MTPTIGGERCDERRCTKNAGHQSPHRIAPEPLKAGRTLAQILGKVATCGRVLEEKNDAGITKRHRCMKPFGHHSTHHSGSRSWL